MSTGIHGAMFDSLADLVVELDIKHDVHTVVLTLNGQHGEFDVNILADDDDMEAYSWKGVVRRHGGVSDVREINVCRFCGLKPGNWRRPCRGVATGSHELGEHEVSDL